MLYYRKIGDILVPKLCTYINGIGTKWVIRKEALEVAITISPKEGKDATLCLSYRPISLLNDDKKLFAKVMVGGLKLLLSELVHSDQAGFVPRRECRDNGIRILLAEHELKESGTPGLLLSIDTEKAFDRVD